jgi:hypothetical protein
MASFAPGQVIVTSDPFIQVDPMPAGTYRFQLVVEDQAGNPSLPVEVMVQVMAQEPIHSPPPPIGRIPTPIGRMPPRTPVIDEPGPRIPIFKQRGGLADF